MSIEQQELLTMVERLLSDHAGATRARQCRSDGAPDAALRSRFEEVGLRDFLRDTSGPAMADQVLVVEACGRHVVQLHAAALFVGPKVSDRWAVAHLERTTSAVRMPAALEGIVVGGTRATAYGVSGAEVLRASWGDAWGSVTLGEPEAVDASSAEIAAWYRLALVAEAVGAAGAALDLTIRYLVDRHQFGAPIASRQAVRHRLVELQGEIDAARLLTYEAASAGADPRGVAMAATALVGAARRLVPDLQRFTGAIGFSVDYDLHLFTGRVRSIVAELGPPERLARLAFGAPEGEQR